MMLGLMLRDSQGVRQAFSRPTFMFRLDPGVLVLLLLVAPTLPLAMNAMPCWSLSWFGEPRPVRSVQLRTRLSPSMF